MLNYVLLMSSGQCLRTPLPLMSEVKRLSVSILNHAGYERRYVHGKKMFPDLIWKIGERVLGRGPANISS